jgi:hypothetical protein
MFQRILTFVFLAGLTLVAISCKQLQRDVRGVPAEAASNPNSPYGPPIKIGTIRTPGVNESSGLVASRVNPGVYWTHNDSGDGPFLYAFDQTGTARGVLRLTGASARDWEDMASGPGPQANKSYLYIGDIGDNELTRQEIVLYRIVEPTLAATDAESTKKKARSTEPVEAIRLRYPDGSHDAETLLVHPTSGNVYVVTKIPFEKAAVYEAVAPLNPNKVTTMKRVGELAVPSLAGGVLTGGSISPDGTRVALCDYFQGYEVVLPSGSKNFDDIWKEKLSPIDLGRREQGEAIAYRLDGKALVATSEGRSSAVVEVRRK